MSRHQPTTRAESEAPLLALDSASPKVSVAVGRGDWIAAVRSLAIEHSSGHLVGLIDQALGEARIAADQLTGVVALAGPGSFTGLRVGLATAYGLHQSLGIAATTLPSHAVLAEWLRLERPDSDRCLAVVDALRDRWFVQPFALDSGVRALEPPRLEAAADLALRYPRSQVVGFGSERLPDLAANGSAAIEPETLAPAALSLATAPETRWDAASLLSPLYLREPAVAPPRRRGGRDPRLSDGQQL